MDLARLLRDPQHQLLLGAAVVLLGVLTWSVMSLEVWHQVFLALGVALGATYFARASAFLVVTIALQAYIGLLYWVPGTIAGLSLLEAFGGAAFVLVAAHLGLRMRDAQRLPLFGACAAYTALLMVGGMRASTAMVGLGDFTRYAGPIALLLVASVSLTSSRSQRGAALFVTAMGLVPLVVSFYVLATRGLEADTRGILRLRGGFLHISTQGQTMAFLACAAFAIGDAWRGRLRWASWVYAAGCAACVYLSQSRTSQLGLAVFLGAYLLLRRRFGMLGVLGVVAGAAVANSELLQERFSDIPAFFSADPMEGDAAIDDLGSGRIGIWRSSLEGFGRGRPGDLLFGIGMGDQRFLVEDASERGRASHNDYLTILFQLGPLGLLLYLWLMLRSGVEAWSLRREVGADSWERHLAEFALATLVSAAVMDFFSNAYVSRVNTSWLLWGAIGLVFATRARVLAARRSAGDPRTHRGAPAPSRGAAPALDVPHGRPV